MKKEYDVMKISYQTSKEAYEAVKSQMKRIQARLAQYSETSKILENKYKIKQQVVNKYIDEAAELKCKMAELEQENNKLHSYHASSYIPEHIFNIKPRDNDLKRSRKELVQNIIRFHHRLRKFIHSMMTKRWQKLSTWLINCQIT
ncbi:hypothetical protein Hanom_Chr00s003055g01708351 [Helianthus anomalus]